MSSTKHKFLFIVLTCSAYISPLLMIMSLWSNYWLLSTEMIPISKENMAKAVVTLTELGKITMTTTPKQPTTTYNSFFPPTYAVYANYGVWQYCKTSDPPRDQISCQYIKYFQGIYLFEAYNTFYRRRKTFSKYTLFFRATILCLHCKFLGF